MLDKPLFALSSSHEAQINPHQFLYSHVAEMHEQRIWQIRGPILPCGKRQPCVLRIDRPQANSEGRGVMFPTRPSLPKQGAPSTFASSPALIPDPEQLGAGGSGSDHSSGRDSWNYAATFQRVTWDRGPQLLCCVIRRRCAIAHSTRARMSISETRVRWTGHFSAISSSFERWRRTCLVQRLPASPLLQVLAARPSRGKRSPQAARTMQDRISLLWR
jgi:hypothetical protein